MSSVMINGRKANGTSGRTILETARDVGIVIPTLCYHKDLSVAGSCRLCLVGEMTRRAKGLLEVYPESLVEVSPEDAAKLGLGENSKVRVQSRRGEMVARAIITDRVSPGVVFGNFHFPGPQNVNNVTIAALDPIAKIPEYKVCAVAVEVVPDAPPSHG